MHFLRYNQLLGIETVDPFEYRRKMDYTALIRIILCQSNRLKMMMKVLIFVEHRIPKDSAVTVCRSTSKSEVCISSFFFFVSYKKNKLFLVEPIKFLSKPDSIYHLVENDRLVLPCVVYGNPQPTIKWYKVCCKLFRFPFVFNSVSYINIFLD